MFPHCMDWNPLTLNCSQCMRGYYMAGGESNHNICCREKSKYKSEHVCEPIAKSNCLREIDGDCTKCSKGYILDNNKEC